MRNTFYHQSDSLKKYYFNYPSPHLWKNQDGIERGINYFRDNVIEEFVKLVPYNLVDSFELFVEQTYLLEIETKEDFKFFLNGFYDDLGECNYFEHTQYEGTHCYKQWIRELWSDEAIKYSEVKDRLKKLKKINTISLDGLLDNMLHYSDKFIDLLPSSRAYSRYRINKNALMSEEMMFKYLESIEFVNKIENEKTKTIQE